MRAMWPDENKDGKIAAFILSFLDEYSHVLIILSVHNHSSYI